MKLFVDIALVGKIFNITLKTQKGVYKQKCEVVTFDIFLVDRTHPKLI